ncbi:hypothetical protein THER5_1976 [Bifidobacterium thermacidophilum subsp. thermacidophilum]|uniref:Uncharacterized protein n=1 Tax=Bifidobacterium thermacidophilum subsp. thermacidophilum TaxID=79262 RepID=A0A087E490_9BIFI|nr:hypothetical protein THER5_1976 [Bifidobacterium thermacidophilum subsp. thermacidophilum]
MLFGRSCRNTRHVEELPDWPGRLSQDDRFRRNLPWSAGFAGVGFCRLWDCASARPPRHRIRPRPFGRPWPMQASTPIRCRSAMPTIVHPPDCSTLRAISALCVCGDT